MTLTVSGTPSVEREEAESPVDSEVDPELAVALAVSAEEQAVLRRQLEDEQRALDEVLRLSLLEK